LKTNGGDENARVGKDSRTLETYRVTGAWVAGLSGEKNRVGQTNGKDLFSVHDIGINVEAGISWYKGAQAVGFLLILISGEGTSS